MKKPANIKNVVEVVDQYNDNKVHVFFECKDGVYYNQKVSGEFFYKKSERIDELHGYFDLYLENRPKLTLPQLRSMIDGILDKFESVTVIKRGAYYVIRVDVGRSSRVSLTARRLASYVRTRLGQVAKPATYSRKKGKHEYYWAEALIPA